MRRVLDRVQADETHALPQEVVGAQPHREQVVVPRVPADGGHVLLALLFVAEPPDGQLVALVLHRVEAVPVAPVVLNLGSVPCSRSTVLSARSSPPSSPLF